VTLRYDVAQRIVTLSAYNAGDASRELTIRANAYRTDGPWVWSLAPRKQIDQRWSVVESGNWYDFSVSADGFERRFAGRLETGSHSVSDPANPNEPP
jgi:phospholipase C